MPESKSIAAVAENRRLTKRELVVKNLKKNLWLYVMFFPVIVYYIIFKYAPMFGIVIAFKDYNAFRGIWASEWVGFKHFINFFESPYFWRLIRNTFLISFYGLVWGFPAPVILTQRPTAAVVFPFPSPVYT